MNDQENDVSIIIPVKNGIKGSIEQCLKGVFSQKTQLAFEVIVIDSGSTDGTLEIIKSFPAIRLIQIEPKEFGHGKTRNLGASKAQGKYLFFLNQDAIPANDQWLGPLIKDMEEDEIIAAVYSRHLPKPNCYLYMRRDIEKSMPAHKIVKTKANPFDFMLFSTVSAAVRRSVWQELPFDDQIMIAEDQEWAKKVLAAGCKIVYEPESTVYHSHNYFLRELFDIKFKVGKASKAMGSFHGPFGGLIIMFGGITVKTVQDIVYILRSKILPLEKVKEIGLAIAGRMVSFVGRYLGSVVG